MDEHKTSTEIMEIDFPDFGSFLKWGIEQGLVQMEDITDEAL